MNPQESKETPSESLRIIKNPENHREFSSYFFRFSTRNFRVKNAATTVRNGIIFRTAKFQSLSHKGRKRYQYKPKSRQFKFDNTFYTLKSIFSYLVSRFTPAILDFLLMHRKAPQNKS